MILKEDVLNELRRSLVENIPFEIKNLKDYLRFKDENLVMFCRFLANFKDVKIKVDKDGVNVLATPVPKDIDEDTLKRARAKIWNYDVKRKLANPEKQLLKMCEESDDEENVKYGELNENIINLMQGAKEFLQDKFELVDNEVFLSFSKEISEANITNDFLQKILMVARNVEYISLIPMFEENGKDVKSLRFLMGYEKRVK